MVSYGIRKLAKFRQFQSIDILLLMPAPAFLDDTSQIKFFTFVGNYHYRLLETDFQGARIVVRTIELTALKR